ncbi:transposase [Rickettsiales endosymbiont of Trichoplax sp. H2]|uniref:transposase n=1 Tax=Rickettsiales endosymbiont of Trichoplax sp. H2 TaxID=2021221 RepID=UPI0012B310E0
MVKRNRIMQMKLSEIITIMISYHASGTAYFKHYYFYLKSELKDLFQNMAPSWFFGFKLHMLFNTHREVVRLAITPGSIDDCQFSLKRDR